MNLIYLLFLRRGGLDRMSGIALEKIRKYLDKPTTEIMVNCLIMSKLDYNNALLSGVNDYLIARMQRCQNYAAKVVTLKRNVIMLLQY